MTTTLQARVDEELAQAVRRRANEEGVSVSGYLTELVRRDVRQAQDDAFWQSFTDYYSDPEHVAEAQAEAERYAETLTDGIEPDGAGT